MMTCEKCEKELLSGTVICRHCNHNNALQKIEAWREKRTQRLVPSAPTDQTAAASLRLRRNNAKDGTLIRFPKQPPSAEKPTLAETSEQPVWKQRLNARLQEIREQRAAEIEPPASPRHSVSYDPDPRIAAALSRINRADYLPHPPPRRNAGGAALAENFAPLPEVGEMPLEQVISGSSKPAPKPLVSTLPAIQSEPAIANALEIPLQETSYPVLEIEEPIVASELAIDQVGEGEISSVVEDLPILEAAYNSGSTLEAAALRLRLAAAVIDAEIIALSFLPLFAVFAFFGGKFDVFATPFYVLTAVALCLITLYFFLTYSLAGRTVGMALLKLHLASRSPIHEEEAPSTVTFTFNQASARALGGAISLLLFPLNVVCITRSYDRLSISDYLSDTQIVRIKK